MILVNIKTIELHSLLPTIHSYIVCFKRKWGLKEETYTDSCKVVSAILLNCQCINRAALTWAGKVRPMLAAVNPPPTTCHMAMLSLACLLLHMQGKRGGALVTCGQSRLSHAIRFWPHRARSNQWLWFGWRFSSQITNESGSFPFFFWQGANIISDLFSHFKYFCWSAEMKILMFAENLWLMSNKGYVFNPSVLSFKGENWIETSILREKREWEWNRNL